MANTHFGCDLLNIPHNGLPVVSIAKNEVRYLLGKKDGLYECMSDFRVGAKWANIIRSRFSQFRSAAKYFEVSAWEQVGKSMFSVDDARILGLTLTAYPDPNTETTSVDGELYNEVAVWATNHDALICTNPDDSSTTFNMQATRLYSLRRVATLFDTSALTASATISAAVASFYVTGKGDALSDSLRLVTSNPASNTALVAADFNQALWGTTALATDKTLASITTSAYNDYTLTDLTVVSKTSITKLGLRSVVIDIANAEPTAGANSVTMSAAENTGTAQDPKLVVTYTVPAAFVPRIIIT